MLAFAPVWGRWVASGGPRPVMLTGFTLMGLGALGLVFYHASVFDIELFIIPTLVGNVAVLIAMSNIIVLSVSAEELGIQTGMNQTFRNLGSAVGPVLAAAITASYVTAVLLTPPPLPPIYRNVPTITGFIVLFEITAAVAVVGFILTLGLRNYRFRADGTRVDTLTGSPAPSPKPVVGEPTPSASTER